jgi:glucose-6-phosphate 1-epimerase
VPLCFPQFATRGRGPRHGFARSTEWAPVEQRDIDGTALLTLQLPLEAHRAHWPFDAQVEFSVLLDATRLDLELGVDNLGDAPLQFNAALHSYFAVSDIEDVVLTGLRGTRYLDTTASDAENTERSDALRIVGEIDRIHGPVQGALMLRDDNGALGIHGDQFPDVVVWNPGPDKAAALADLAPGDWRRFVCVEAGAILDPVTLAAGESWWGRQSLVDLTLTVRAQGDA